MLLLLALLPSFSTPQSGSPTITVHDREIAIPGDGTFPVYETDVAVSAGAPAVVCVGSPQFRSAVRNTSTGVWTQLTVSGPSGMDDPCIELGSTAGTYLITARRPGGIRFATYPPGPSCGTDLCMQLAMPSSPEPCNDKPWLLRGGFAGEDFVFYWRTVDSTVAFLHTKDEFTSQAGGTQAPHEVGVPTEFNAQPTLAVDGVLSCCSKAASRPCPCPTCSIPRGRLSSRIGTGTTCSPCCRRAPASTS
jgi:hypothetical protein